MAQLKKFPVVYRSLDQALKTLRTSEVGKSSEVKQLLKTCSAAPNAILDSQLGLKIRPISVLKPKQPLIIMEGLDGSGKTKVSTALSQQLDLDRMATPPPQIKFLKEFFDEQRESVRRAYYSIGNYLAAQEVANTKGLKGIMIDRYWPSTCAYAVAQKTVIPESDANAELPADWYEWPDDLLKPQLVLFLVVSEKIRQYRHKVVRNTTNTPEEQALATNSAFRETLIQSYKRIEGVPIIEINADPEIEDITRFVHDLLIEKFPTLRKQS